MLGKPLARLLLAGLALAGLATSADAGELRGKWGLGAGVFNHESEASILFALSDRVAWVLTVAAGYTDETVSYGNAVIIVGADAFKLPDLHGNSSQLTLGPAIRVFTRPGEDFSPYFEFFTLGSWASERPPDEFSDIFLDYWSARAGLAIGAEYFFTRWNCSLAVHNETLAFQYSHLWGRALGTGIFPSPVDETTASASIVFRPGLVARVYF